MTSAKPSIAAAIGYCGIKENDPFSFNIAHAFLPDDGSLVYGFSHCHLPWLHIDPEEGEIYGEAPKVTHDRVYKITVIASNNLGVVTQSFTLKIICTDIVETTVPTLELVLNLRKEKYGFSHLHPYTPSLLEYIYTFYQLAEFNQAFKEALNQQAGMFNKQISEHLSFQEFKDLMKQLNPNIEQHLQEHQRKRIASLTDQLAEHPELEENLLVRIEEEKALLFETLSNEQLQNLFRQGSQQLGVIAIPIFNYLAAPDQYNWSDWNTVDNVLDAAAHALSKLRKANQEQLNHVFRPELKPKGGV